MDDVGRTIRYLFLLAVILILVVYFAGASQLGTTIFGGVNQLGLTFTGRNKEGQFSAYPMGAPATK